MAKNKIIFHIGLPKTGSTYLQEMIFPKLKNINYINIAKENYFKDLDFDIPSQFFNSEKYSFKKKTLLSSEGLSGGFFNNINVFVKFDNLINKFGNFKVIIFIRKQDDLAKSIYLQSIKTGSSISISRFFDKIISKNPEKRKAFNPKIHNFLYLEYIDYIVNKMGKNKVLIIPYEDLKKNPESTIKKICYFLKVPKIKNIPKKSKNVSLGNILALFLRFTNQFFRNRNNPNGFINIKIFNKNISLNSLIYRLLKFDFFRKINFPYKDKTGTCKRILEMCKENNKKLDKKYNLGLKKYGYY